MNPADDPIIILNPPVKHIVNVPEEAKEEKEEDKGEAS